MVWIPLAFPHFAPLNPPPHSAHQSASPPFEKLPVLGGDPTEVLRVERTGGVYLLSGKKVQIFKAMKQAGWTAVRFRLWVNPTEPWCSLSYNLEMAKRAHAAGLKVILDFHYSDTWADPNHQITPKAWKNLDLDQLADQVRTYTRDTVNAFLKEGVPIYAAEIGNEIRNGILWPLGKVSGDDPDQWNNLCQLLKSGMEGLKESKSTQSIIRIIHIDTGGDNRTSRALIDYFRAHQVHFDVIGLSYYPWWHGTLQQLKLNVDDLAQRYPYKVLVAETAYPYVMPTAGESGTLMSNPKQLVPGYPATPAGQADFLKKVTQIDASCGNGWGVLYWAPLWIETPTWPNNWWNLAVANRSGELLPAFSIWK